MSSSIYVEGEKVIPYKGFCTNMDKLAKAYIELEEEGREPSIFTILVRIRKNGDTVFIPWYSYLDQDKRCFYEPGDTPMMKLEKLRNDMSFKWPLFDENVVHVDFNNRRVLRI